MVLRMPRATTALLLAALVAVVAAASPPLYALVSDALDADAPRATLPDGPVELALADLAQEQPKAVLLAPLSSGERNGLRYALAAWQGVPGAMEWDAMLVVATPAGARTLEISSTNKDHAAALEALIAYGTVGAAPAPVLRVPAAPVAALGVARLPVPTAFEPRFVVLYSANPAYRPGDAAAEAALSDAHVQYGLRLQHEGRALAAGPFAPGSGDATATVADEMSLLRVRDLAAAQGIANADPAVVAGRVIVTVREWRVPAGKLQ